MVPTGPAEPLLMACVGPWFTEFMLSVSISYLSRSDESSVIELYTRKMDLNT